MTDSDKKVPSSMGHLFMYLYVEMMEVLKVMEKKVIPAINKAMDGKLPPGGYLPREYYGPAIGELKEAISVFEMGGQDKEDKVSYLQAKLLVLNYEMLEDSAILAGIKKGLNPYSQKKEKQDGYWNV